MNRRVICAVLALMCFVSMYIPVIAPRYPARVYHADKDGYESEYYYMDGNFCAKEYWDITRYVFARSVVGRVLLSMLQALLLLWAWLCVRGEAGKKGLAIALANFAATWGVLIAMLVSMWGCRWGMLALIALDSAAAVVMAADWKKRPRKA